jgi:hypothetical protein
MPKLDMPGIRRTYLYYSNYDSKDTKQQTDAFKQFHQFLDTTCLENLIRVKQNFAPSLAVHTASLRYVR